MPFIEHSPDFVLHSVFQRSPSTSKHNAPKDHPEALHFTSLEPFLADEKLDLVVITSIPSTHYEFVTAALNAGKHVLCEKPFVPTSSEARDLAELAASKGLVLSVYQNRRYDAEFLTLQNLLKSGRLGRVTEVESHFDRHRPDPPKSADATWKSRDTSSEAANGAIYDLGTHLIDQLVVALGIPARVTGFLYNQRIYQEQGTGEGAGGDSFTVMLHYKDGLVATAKALVVSPLQKQLRFAVRGTKGSFVKYGLDPQEDQLKEGLRPGDKDGKYGTEDKSLHGILETVGSDGTMQTETVKPNNPPDTYDAFYAQLFKALRNGGKAPASADQAAEVLRIIEAIRKSSEEGRTIDV